MSNLQSSIHHDDYDDDTVGGGVRTAADITGSRLLADHNITTQTTSKGGSDDEHHINIKDVIGTLRRLGWSLPDMPLPSSPPEQAIPSLVHEKRSTTALAG
ncbi:hypothetical protein FOZ63_011401, partial [Perkinsus olseni]